MSEGKKEILLGDCLELMKDIPNGSIDMILCDLPYGTTACSWDAIIPFDALWKEYERVIKPIGAIVLTASQPFTSALLMSNTKMFKYETIWIKNQPTGIGLSNKRPMKYHENILIFCKGNTTYNKQKSERWSDKAKSVVRNGVGGANTANSENTNISSKVPPKRFYDENNVNPKSVLFFDCVANGGGKRLHPTQKPIALFEYLIKTYTNENDLVLDNTAGSGTTAIACLNTKRQFIVMEKEQKYYDIILKRVADFNKNFEPQTIFGNEM